MNFSPETDPLGRDASPCPTLLGADHRTLCRVSALVFLSVSVCEHMRPSARTPLRSAHTPPDTPTPANLHLQEPRPRSLTARAAKCSESFPDGL